MRVFPRAANIQDGEVRSLLDEFRRGQGDDGHGLQRYHKPGIKQIATAILYRGRGDFESQRGAYLFMLVRNS